MTLAYAYHHTQAVEEFEIALQRAKWYAVYAALRGKENQLRDFAGAGPLLGTRHYRGIQEIPAQAIVGSLNRCHDFDGSFRPLRRHLVSRWARAYALAQTRGWHPIRVCQVGDVYFVEDGHHRVSVARHLDIDRIEAEVWEYPLAARPALESTSSLDVCSTEWTCFE
jgi:hypothetical protein